MTDFVKPIERDLAEARLALAEWLPAHLSAGAPVEVTAIRRFGYGLSGDLLDLDVTYADAEGRLREQGLVVRVEPAPSYQVFLDTNFHEQYRVLEAVGKQGVLVPRMIGYESDTTVIGGRFYVMERAPGEPGDSSYAWVKSLDEKQILVNWWTGLEAMVGLHRVDWRSLDLPFLDGRGRWHDPIAQQLDYYRTYYDWVRADEHRAVIETTFEWLTQHKPRTPVASISWGDARPGNQLYPAYDRCSTMVDFEQVYLGTAEMDLGWWCFIEDQRRTAFEVSCPDLADTIRGYGALLGRDIDSLPYYIVFAAFRVAVLRIKLHALRAGQPDQYPRYAGDKNLAMSMLRFVADDMSDAERTVMKTAVDTL